MKLAFALLMCLPLLALDNSVTVHEASGSGQTARPVSLFRTFASGEFSGTFPKPRIAGAAPPAWQVDVKTTWPDGSIQQAFVSFRLDLAANGSAAVDFVADPNPCHLGNQAVCEAAALTQQGMLDHNGGAWSATWYGSVNSIEYSASARAMLTAGAWRWWMKGPVVSAVIAEDRSSALLYDFGWQYSGGVWIAPSEAKYKSLHPVYEIRFYPDPDGAGALTAWPGVEVDAQVWNASMGRLQRFNSITLTLKTGNAEATTAYTVSNKSFHARSRRHKLVWSGTAPGAVVVDYNFPYLIHTRLIPSYDYRLAVASTLADSDLSAYSTYLGSDEVQWCESSNALCGSWQKSVGGTGARGDIAMIARWYLEYLYLMGHSGATVAKKKDVWDKLVIGNADAAGNATIHYMATATGTFYPAAGTDSTVGRVISLEEDRGWWPLYGNQEESSITSPPTFVCGMGSPCDARLHAESATFKNNWSAQGTTDYTTHAPSFYAIPYLLTGYHYYLAGAKMEAAFGMATSTSGANTTGSISTRMYGRGIIYVPDAPRAIAWVHRNIFLAALVSPDGTVEKAYFRNRLQANAAFMEGVMLLAGGAHAPVDPTCASWTRPTSVQTALTADMWCAGRDTWGLMASGTIPASNPTHVPLYTYVQSSNDGLMNGHRRAPAYMMGYIANVWAWIAESGAFIGPDSKPLFGHGSSAMAAHYAGRVLSSANSMYQFRVSDIGWSADPICSTFDACAASAIVSWPLDVSMTDSQTTLDVVAGSDWADGGSSYFNIAWAKIDDEYVRLSGSPALNTPASGKARFTIAQRGVWGSVATTHAAGATVTMLPGFMAMWAAETQGGYPVITGSALNMMAGRQQVGAFSPKRARDRYMGALPYQDLKTGSPQWATAPYEVIQLVTATGGTGTASISWLAPPATVCKVYVGASAPATSSDASDATANATKGRWQTHSATGLSAGTNHYRISCGTARAAGTVTVGAGA